jgi:hypothetical protein
MTLQTSQFNEQSIEDFISQFSIERSGWVYLIHAAGTNRYKIGRSITPETRLKTLNQKQSPYPLELIYKFWSVDAITDEQKIHGALADSRVHGEWFEFERDNGCPWLDASIIPNRALFRQIYYPHTRQKIIDFIMRWLSIKLEQPEIITETEGFMRDSLHLGINECLDIATSWQLLLFVARLIDHKLIDHWETWCKGVPEPETSSMIGSFLSGVRDTMHYFSLYQDGVIK